MCGSFFDPETLAAESTVHVTTGRAAYEKRLFFFSLSLVFITTSVTGVRFNPVENRAGSKRRAIIGSSMSFLPVHLASSFGAATSTLSPALRLTKHLPGDQSSSEPVSIARMVLVAGCR